MKHLADALGISIIWISIAVMVASMAQCQARSDEAFWNNCKGTCIK